MTIFSALSLLIACFVIIFLVRYYFLADSKLPIENNKIALFSERCGVREGMKYVSIPFGRQTFYDDFMVISYGKRELQINYKDIDFVNYKKQLVGTRFMYVKKILYSQKLIFIWSLSPNDIISLLSNKKIDIRPRRVD